VYSMEKFLGEGKSTLICCGMEGERRVPSSIGTTLGKGAGGMWQGRLDWVNQRGGTEGRQEQMRKKKDSEAREER